MKRYILVLFCSIACVTGQCPDEATGLEAWSNPDTWTGQQIIPGSNDNVTISKPILLDTNADVFSVTIASGGKLVWKNQKEAVNLRAHYVLIQGGGELHIGSESCQYDGMASITLVGVPGELSIPGFGEKFIGVEAGGVLELHGKDKLSWTKLTATAPKYDENKGTLYQHREEDAITRRPGVYAYHFDSNGNVVNSIHADFGFRRQSRTDQAIADLVQFLAGVPDGDVVALATQKNILRTDLSALFSALETFGPTRIKDMQNDDAYVLIAIKGSSTMMDDLVEGVPGSSFVEASVTMDLPGRDREIIVVSQNHRRDGRSFSDFIVRDTTMSRPILNVADDVSSWAVGDKIFVASTDYDWRQVEDFTILECASCASNQIKLDRPLRFTHFGEVYKRVDMRAEVGLMTRHIVLRGVASPGNTDGGHVKFLKGFGSVRVEGVEVTGMGQPLVLGRYPLHYHMCEDLDDPAQYPIRSYIRRNSIHHNHFRCVTIHGTHGAMLTDNVCYNSFGHGFFLEDGGEKRTHLEGNLGLGQKRWRGKVKVPITGTIPTDKQKGPVTFWITNPQTTLVNNVAAGGDGVGMWYVYPDIPTGVSKDKGFMQEKEARRTKITKFLNNVAHSYFRAGLFVDNIENQDFTVQGYNRYRPHAIPTDLSSPRIPAVFERLTAYKNRVQNLWIRGTPIIVRNSSFSDSAIGATLTREKPMWQLFENNVVIGQSPNLGNPQRVMNKAGQRVMWPRSMPMWKLSTPILGYRFFKGPVFVKNVWFDGFEPTEEYKAAAVSSKTCDPQADPRSQIENVQFGFTDMPGNRFLYFDCPTQKSQIDLIHSVRDIGGGLSGSENTDVLNSALRQDYTLVKNHPFLTSSKCTTRPSSNAVSCQHTYGRIDVVYNSGNSLSVQRSDGASVSLTGEKEFLAMLGENVGYSLQVDKKVPTVLNIFGHGVTRSNNVVMSLCLPRDAKFLFQHRIGKRIERPSTRVSSKQAVIDSDIGSNYFFDSNTGRLVFKLIHTRDFEAGEMTSCPGSECARVFLKIFSGDANDFDCMSRVTDALIETNNLGVPTEDTASKPVHSSEPSTDMGAGPTYPFN